MIHVMASIVVQPAHADAAKAILVELARATRNEPGCLSYELFQRPDQRHVFQTVEGWREPADADAHMKTPHVAAAIAAAGPMFAAPPAIVSFVRVE